MANLSQTCLKNLDEIDQTIGEYHRIQTKYFHYLNQNQHRSDKHTLVNTVEENLAAKEADQTTKDAARKMRETTYSRKLQQIMSLQKILENKPQ